MTVRRCPLSMTRMESAAAPVSFNCLVGSRALAEGVGPVVDLAFGRGQVAEWLANSTSRPMVATEFNPRVLRRDRRWLQAALDVLLHRRGAPLGFDDSGCRARLVGACRGVARPTSTSSLSEGAGIDGMPVTEAILEW